MPNDLYLEERSLNNSMYLNCVEENLIQSSDLVRMLLVLKTRKNKENICDKVKRRLNLILNDGFI